MRMRDRGRVMDPGGGKGRHKSAALTPAGRCSTLLLAAAVGSWGIWAPPVVGGEHREPTAWKVLEARHPERAAAATAEERRILRLLRWEQLLAWVDGLDPELVELADGRTLAALLCAGFDLSWWTIDGGGGPMAGGGFALDGTLGQPDTSAASGGGFTLAGGFWPTDPHAIFSDGFEAGSAARWSAAVGGAP
jgi:hypothetical protein